MKNNILKLLCATCLSLIMIGCSDDDDSSNPINPNPTDTIVNPITNNGYWNMKVGTYWIYDSFATDTIGNKIGSATSQDSVYVTVSGQIDGKAAYTVSLHKDGKLSSGYSFAPATDELYVTADFVTPFINNIPFIGNSLSIPELHWLKIADTRSASWELFPSPIKVENLALPFEIQGLTNPVLNLNIQALISRHQTDGTMVDPVSGATRKTLTFDVKYLISGTVNGTLMGIMPIEAGISGDMHSYLTFAEGIGLVANYRPTQTLKMIASINELGLKQDIEIFNEVIDGDGTFIVRYKN